MPIEMIAVPTEERWKKSTNIHRKKKGWCGKTKSDYLKCPRRSNFRSKRASVVLNFFQKRASIVLKLSLKFINKIKTNLGCP